MLQAGCEEASGAFERPKHSKLSYFKKAKAMTEAQVQTFWNAHPCGEELVGGIGQDYLEFFNRYDAYRYNELPFMFHCLDAIDFRNKSVLEIGLGLGADSEQIIRRGAKWSGIDLTPTSVARVTKRLELRGLPYSSLIAGTACKLPFDDNSFDIIFSFGVLHHIPDIETAQQEIARVLKPGGRLVCMLYAKYSLNYLLSIAIIRRLALLMLCATGIRTHGKIGEHVENARSMGLFRYLRLNNFIHRNTDGPLNPYSKVYDVAEVKRVFSRFKLVKARKYMMHAPPLPVRWLPLERVLGWCLWCELEKTGE
jgi:SAM-dependent methyltransferase